MIKKYKNIFIVLFIAALTRFFAINQSLWLDEGTTWRVVHGYSYSHILTDFLPFDFHPPLYYFLIKAWTSIFGYSELSLRMPSVIFSLLTGFIIYITVQKLIKQPTESRFKTVPLWAATFFLFNPLIFYYSQEARMYSTVTFFLSVATYAFLDILKNKKPSPKTYLLFNAMVFLSFLTFYGSIFLISAYSLYLLIHKRYRVFLMTAIGLLLSVCLVSPLLYEQLLHARESISQVVNWRAVLGTVNLKNALLIPLKFATGRISPQPKAIYMLVGALCSAVYVFCIVRGGRKWPYLLFLGSVPILLGFLSSFFTPLLQYFRFIYVIPILSILFAGGVSRDRVRTLFLIIFLGFIALYVFFPTQHREDWRLVARDLGETGAVYMIKPSSDPLLYYRPNTTILELRALTYRKPESDLITVIPYASEIYGFNYVSYLKGYIRTSSRSYRGVVIEVWNRAF